ncbi:phosphoethanolamine transferase [Proteus mirabilis]|uniref:Sulfatase n=8 Tax=Proteus TaxID=583 RepID=A0A385JN81_PROMI|nr:phosphoethanolamine transferase [Proteus mirabilis]ALE20824.1 hypothetical protein AOC00_00285 [Proteus mirabilis]ALE23946.1 hypothetical protein AOB99_00285 [Proteus mirabilis]AND14795.1 hypothetical protein AOUC001_18715 [Proteus mirabilis]AXY99479.1 hypothetical protein [Proteus mirabilis]AXY99748.1 sulfatase [Proteus mirabilis]
MKNFFISKYTKLIINIIIYVVPIALLLISSKLMTIGVGGESSVNDVVLLTILIIVLSSSRKAFYFIALPIVLLYALYTPIGITFGKPTYQYIASLFATDLLESGEFLYQIPLINWFCAIAIIILIFSYYFLCRRLNISYYKNRTLICIMVIVSLIDQSPFSFFRNIITSGQKVKEELVKLNSFDKENRWGNTRLTNNSKYDDYILVIGESARKDYHHAYGYPINNTPFMSASNGVLVDGFTSAGTNTIASLRLMLTKPNLKKWEPDYSLNLIDLVKNSGIKTYWISNQGYFGKFDTPISAIANKSDVKIFMKSGTYNSYNISDFELIPRFDKIIFGKSKTKRFIVIHLYGSHPMACDRLFDYKKIIEPKDPKYDYLACYISTINKTDDLLKSLVNSLNKNYQDNNRTYSLIYFSDHGQVHNEVNGKILFNNAFAGKRHYDVPIFKISYDDHERNVIKNFKSGLNFIDGIAHWIGIENDKLNIGYDIFTNKDDQNDYGLSDRIKAINKEDDPAIDIKDK